MSEREDFVSMLDRTGIGYITAKDNGKDTLGRSFELDTNDIVLLEGLAKTKGYSGFFTVFDFDETGKLQGVTIAE